MFYSNYNGREDFPCQKRTSPKSEYKTPVATQSDENENEEN